MKGIKQIIAAALLASGCSFSGYTQPQDLLELPAVTNDGKLITYTGYTVSYNEANRLPEWVAYELTAEETDGSYGRDGQFFRSDDRVRAVQADRYDYNYKENGYTKGHMAPSADFRWSPEAQSDTFYYTNCCPQTEELNGGGWQKIENKARAMARRYGKVWVVSGPIVGTMKNGTIGKHHIVVPDAFFKTFLIWDGHNYKSIGFIMQNSTQPQYMDKCATSVNEIEQRTGLNLYPGLDDSIEESVESQINLADWSIRAY